MLMCCSVGASRATEVELAKSQALGCKQHDREELKQHPNICFSFHATQNIQLRSLLIMACH